MNSKLINNRQETQGLSLGLPLGLPLGIPLGLPSTQQHYTYMELFSGNVSMFSLQEFSGS